MYRRKLAFASSLLLVIFLVVAGCTMESTKEETLAHAEQVHWGYGCANGEEGPTGFRLVKLNDGERIGWLTPHHYSPIDGSRSAGWDEGACAHLGRPG